MHHKKGRLVIVSNRLPVTVEKAGDEWSVTHSSGGLVSALSPILRDRGGIWIGWTGTTESTGIQTLRTILGPASREAGYRIFPVRLSAEEVSRFYYGFSNEVIWPLFHDLQTQCNFDHVNWEAYCAVNGIFARETARHSRPDDTLWIHDYQLIPLARKLGEAGHERRCVFFLHIPFPPPDIFLKMPWRFDLLRDMLEYEFLGFQTYRDRKNFFDCVRVMDSGARTSGRGPVVTLKCMGTETRIANMPISIDYACFRQLAGSEKVKTILRELHTSIYRDIVVLGVDRLDYTKGIPEKLKAFRQALLKYPHLKERITLVQIVVPSRQKVPAYQELLEQIEKLVSQINGEFTSPGWIPVHYMYQSVSREELAAFYRLADIALVTPLKDGMNLVAKEYCACQIGNRGVLILSEFAGAAAQMQRDAIMVNSYDVEGMADAIEMAASMPDEEKKRRMKRMRNNIRRRDVFWWVDNFLRASTGRRLLDFPQSEMAPVLHAVPYCLHGHDTT